MLEGMKPPQKQPLHCKVWDIRESLEPGDLKIFDAAMLNTEEWSHSNLSLELKKRGILVGRETVRNHRNGDCLCANA
jgi:hypothetical protein